MACQLRAYLCYQLRFLASTNVVWSVRGISFPARYCTVSIHIHVEPGGDRKRGPISLIERRRHHHQHHQCEFVRPFGRSFGEDPDRFILMGNQTNWSKE